MVKDVEITIETCDEKEQEISANFEDISYKLMDGNQEMIFKDTIVFELLLMIHQELQAAHFILASINKLTGYHFYFDPLQTILEKNIVAIIGCYNVIIKTTAIASNTGVPDSDEMQESLRRSQEFMDRNEEDEEVS